MAQILVKKLRPLFKIHGGKYYLCDWVVNHFPANYEDLKYVETSGGAASVLLNKKMSKIEIFNDLDPRIANIFHCMRYQSADFIQAIKDVSYSEKSFKDAGKVDFIYEDYISGVAELVLRRMSRGGLRKHFSWSQRLRGGRPGDLNAWETFKNLLPHIANRLVNVEISNLDHVEVIKAHDSPSTLFYCDPPYIHSTRTAANAYTFEMSDEQHRNLGDALVACQGKVIISGYDCALYQEMFKGWRCESKSVKNNAGQNRVKSTRTECLWLNY